EGTFSLVVGGLSISALSGLLPSALTTDAPGLRLASVPPVHPFIPAQAAVIPFRPSLCPVMVRKVGHLVGAIAMPLAREVRSTVESAGRQPPDRRIEDHAVAKPTRRRQVPVNDKRSNS